MTAATPRLRMFAGPNGSGKSTLKSYLPPPLLGVYLNPDDIEQEISNLGFLDFSSYGVTTTASEVMSFFSGSSFLASARDGAEFRCESVARRLRIESSCFAF